MSEDAESKLARFIIADKHNPSRFVHTAYPWGKGELKDSKGPRIWQASVLNEIGEHLTNPATRYKPKLISIASGHGVGKLHPMTTVVPTPSGLREWGTLGIGDRVFGKNGEPTRIKAVRYYDNVPMYRITFDDRSYCDVSSGHLWNVKGRSERRHNWDQWRTVETIELARLGAKRSNGKSQARQWEIPIQEPAQFDEQPLKIHPYLMGLWLGDGTKEQPEYTKPYLEIAEKVRSFGYELTTQDHKAYRILHCAHLFKGGVFGFNSHDRYIPDEYKYNTVENRRALLEGLCDSDGEAHSSGSIGYSSTSLRLVEDVIWLARSLGGKAFLQDAIKQGWYPDADGNRVSCRDCYRATINLPFNPFTLQHRKERYKPSETRYLTRWIDSIEPLPSTGGMCIEVEAPDGLYLANDFIVTHNSSLISMIVHWGLSTFIDCRVIVTANTENQLRTKTWPEISKWFRLGLNSHWFDVSKTSVSAKAKGHEGNWRADAIPWSENNTEAFAGLHNQGKRIIIVFDEGSSISDEIYEVTEGALTDANTEIIWLVFGNPTINTGRFRACFGRFKHRWSTRQIDSRTVEGTNKELMAKWIEDYGEDSDFVRVRVKGEFPRAGTNQFIRSDLVDDARRRDPEPTLYDPIIIGVDVARFGDDETVFAIRRGRDASSIPWVHLRSLDTMVISNKLIELALQIRPDAIFVDGGGVGGGVIDYLRLRKLPIIEVQFGASPDGTQQTADGGIIYANKRAEMWGVMKSAMPGLSIPDDPDLAEQLTSIDYELKQIDGRDAILLESKKKMAARGLASPDRADALALTYALPVLPSDHSLVYKRRGQPNHLIDYNPLDKNYTSMAQQHQIEYDPFAR